MYDRYLLGLCIYDHHLCLLWQRIWDKIGYHSVCIGDISRNLASSMGFRVRTILNDVSQILPWPILVAIATKFETKSAITRLVQEILWRSLRKMGVLGSGISQILPQLTPHGNKIRQNRLQLGLYGEYRWDPCAYHCVVCVFELRLFNDVRKILLRVTPDVMATKQT